MKMSQKYKYSLFFLLAIGVGLNLVWIIQVSLGHVPYLDLWTRDLVEKLDDTFIYTFFRFITEFGSRTFTIPFVVVMSIVLFFLYRKFIPVLIFAGGTYAVHLLNQWIKGIIQRERPSILEEANALGYSFPSGHAMISIVCYGLACFFICKIVRNKRVVKVLQLFFSLFIFLIGISRYIINVHYLTDVAAGFVFGFICLITLIYIYEWAQHRRRSKI